MLHGWHTACSLRRTGCAWSQPAEPGAFSVAFRTAKPCAFAYADRSADDQAADDRPAVDVADAHADRAADTDPIAPADGGSDAETHCAAEPCTHDGTADESAHHACAHQPAEPAAYIAAESAADIPADTLA